MPKAYILSDRAIQIDWDSNVLPDRGPLYANQLASYSTYLTQSLQALSWPRFQCVQADLSITVLFVESIFAKGQHAVLLDQINQMVSKLEKSAIVQNNAGCHHSIVVNYGGVAGQDLVWLAEQSGLSPEEVIELHSNASYMVQFLGFLPGFAYLTGLPKQLQFPRRERPRQRVPAGTLAIGAHYCAVYPWESPGGWHLLGHVEQVLFDPERTDQEGRSLFKAGDTVQFIQADHA